MELVLIAFARLDTCGEQPETFKIAQSVLYRSAVRFEAYAHRKEAQHLHAASQHKQLTQQLPARTGPIDFIFGELLNTSPREQSREPLTKKLSG